jgi:hypothetical protein
MLKPWNSDADSDRALQLLDSNWDYKQAHQDPNVSAIFQLDHTRITNPILAANQQEKDIQLIAILALHGSCSPNSIIQHKLSYTRPLKPTVAIVRSNYHRVFDELAQLTR